MRGHLSLISGFLLPLLQLMIIQKYITAFFGPGSRKPAGYAGWLIYYAFLVTTSFGILFPPHILLFGNILMVFMVSTVARKNSLKKRCICTLLICTIWMLVEVIVLLVLAAVSMDMEVIEDAGSFISKMCMLVFSVLLGRYTKGKPYSEIPLRYFAAILLVPVSSIYMMHHILLMAASREEYALFTVTAGILLLFVNYVIFTVYDWMGRAAELWSQNQLYEQQLNLCSRQAEEREGFYLELRWMQHDMKNHLAGILGMVKAGKTKEAREYIQKMLDDVGGREGEVSRSGNIVVDSLVNHKYALALKDGIRFDASVFVPSVLPFQAGHLAVILGNLLENALEGCRRLPLAQRYIVLECTYRKGMLQICIRNSCPKELRRDSAGRYLTTKEDAGCHGIGLVSVELAVASYDGELVTRYGGGEFQASAVLYGSGNREK